MKGSLPGHTICLLRDLSIFILNSSLSTEFFRMCTFQSIVDVAYYVAVNGFIDFVSVPALCRLRDRVSHFPANYVPSSRRKKHHKFEAATVPLRELWLASS